MAQVGRKKGKSAVLNMELETYKKKGGNGCLFLFVIPAEAGIHFGIWEKGFRVDSRLHGNDGEGRKGRIMNQQEFISHVILTEARYYQH